jgi:hypothetical protein
MHATTAAFHEVKDHRKNHKQVAEPDYQRNNKEYQYGDEQETALNRNSVVA